MEKVTDNIFILVLLSMAGFFLLALSFIYFFVRYQRKIQAQKTAMQKAELAHREGLLSAAIQSQEEERRRIGRDLHDDIGSALSNLRMVMGEIVTSDERTAASAASAKYKPLIDDIITNVRTISHSLSPPGLELFGLEHTLYELCDSFNISGTLNLSLENNAGRLLESAGKENSLALYRVLQELLANTVKHAGATHAAIVFTAADDNLLMHYNDNGKGMTLESGKKPGMGMQNIESRLRIINAAYYIGSAPNMGFNIFVTLPIKALN